MKIKRNMSTPESVAFWEECQRAALSVADWPEWRRAGINELSSLVKPRTSEPLSTPTKEGT